MLIRSQLHKTVMGSWFWQILIGKSKLFFCFSFKIKTLKILTSAHKLCKKKSLCCDYSKTVVYTYKHTHIHTRNIKNLKIFYLNKSVLVPCFNYFHIYLNTNFNNLCYSGENTIKLNKTSKYRLHLTAWQQIFYIILSITK